MISYRITTAVLGACIFLVIIRLVRRGKLQEKYSIIWFSLGIIVFLLGFFPTIIDYFARLTGINYAPTLLLVIAVAILLIQNLYLYIFASQNEIRIRGLIQEISVLKKLVQELTDRDKYESPASET